MHCSILLCFLRLFFIALRGIILLLHSLSPHILTFWPLSCQSDSIWRVCPRIHLSSSPIHLTFGCWYGHALLAGPRPAGPRPAAPTQDHHLLPVMWVSVGFSVGPKEGLRPHPFPSTGLSWLCRVAPRGLDDFVSGGASFPSTQFSSLVSLLSHACGLRSGTECPPVRQE